MGACWTRRAEAGWGGVEFWILRPILGLGGGGIRVLLLVGSGALVSSRCRPMHLLRFRPLLSWRSSSGRCLPRTRGSRLPAPPGYR